MNRLSKYGIEQVISAVIAVAVIAIFPVYIVSAGVNGINSIGEGMIVDKRISSITNQKVFCPKTRYFTIEGEYEAYRIGDWYER